MTNKFNNFKSRNDQVGSEQFGERISSFVDEGHGDALDAEGCINHLIESGDAGHRWERYHLIGDALRRNLPPVIDSQLASRVMAELENEPTVLAPTRMKLSLSKQMAGLAVAASVATVAVLGVQFMYKEDGMAPSSQVAQLQGSPSLANKQLQSRDIQTVTQTMNSVDPRSQQLAQPLVQQHPAQVRKQYHPNINKYLLNHNQRAARGVVQGVVPYARIITYPDMERIARQNYLQNQIQK